MLKAALAAQGAHWASGRPRSPLIGSRNAVTDGVPVRATKTEVTSESTCKFPNASRSSRAATPSDASEPVAPPPWYSVRAETCDALSLSHADSASEDAQSSHEASVAACGTTTKLLSLIKEWRRDTSYVQLRRPLSIQKLLAGRPRQRQSQARFPGDPARRRTYRVDSIQTRAGVLIRGGQYKTE